MSGMTDAGAERLVHVRMAVARVRPLHESELDELHEAHLHVFARLRGEAQAEQQAVYLIRGDFGGWNEQSKGGHDWWEGRANAPERRVLYTRPQAALSSTAAPDMPPPGKPFVGCQCPNCGEEFAASAAPAPVACDAVAKVVADMRERADDMEDCGGCEAAWAHSNRIFADRLRGEAAPEGQGDIPFLWFATDDDGRCGTGADRATAVADLGGVPEAVSRVFPLYERPNSAAPAPVAGDAVARLADELMDASDVEDGDGNPGASIAFADAAGRLRTALAQDRASQAGYHEGLAEGIKIGEASAAQEARMKVPPCVECGAKTQAEAEGMCICSGDKDDCHGCELWPGDASQAGAAVPNGWRLVPIVPTDAMETAHAMYGDTSDWWNAVIDAAPTPAAEREVGRG